MALIPYTPAAEQSAPAIASPAITRPEPRQGPDLVLVALGAGILTAVWHIQDLFPLLGMLRPAIGSIAAAAFLLLLDKTPARRTRWRAPVFVPLLAYVAILIAILPASLDPVLSTTMLTQQIIPTVALAFMIAIAVRNGRDLEWLVMINVIGATIYGLYALVRIPVGPDGRWTALVGYDNNDFALLAVATVPLAFFLVQSGRDWKWRAAGFLGSAVLMICIARTGSRGGLLGLAAVLGYLVLTYRTVAPKARMGAVIAGVILVSLAGRAQIAKTIETIKNPKSDYNWAGNDYDGRLELWKRGLGYIETHPIAGVGLAAFPVAEGQLSEVARRMLAHGQKMKTLVAHNMYVQVAAELGLIAFGIFMFMLWRTYRTFAMIAAAYEPRGPAARPGVTRAGPETTLPRLLAASLIGYCFCAIFIAAAYFSLLPVLVGFAGAAARIVPVWVTESRRRKAVVTRPVFAESFDPAI